MSGASIDDLKEPDRSIALYVGTFGWDNATIAYELGLTEVQVKRAMGRLKLKLGVSNRTQVALRVAGVLRGVEHR